MTAISPSRSGTSREAAERTGGTLITVKGGGHSWILRDPETLPAIVAQLLPGSLGQACRDAIRRGGVTAKEPTTAQIEQALYRPDARIFDLTPATNVTTVAGRHRRPKSLAGRTLVGPVVAGRRGRRLVVLAAIVPTRAPRPPLRPTSRRSAALARDPRRRTAMAHR